MANGVTDDAKVPAVSGSFVAESSWSRPDKASRRSGRSATRSSGASTRCSPNSSLPESSVARSVRSLIAGGGRQPPYGTGLPSPALSGWRRRCKVRTASPASCTSHSPRCLAGLTRTSTTGSSPAARGSRSGRSAAPSAEVAGGHFQARRCSRRVPPSLGTRANAHAPGRMRTRLALSRTKLLRGPGGPPLPAPTSCAIRRVHRRKSTPRRGGVPGRRRAWRGAGSPCCAIRC